MWIRKTLILLVLLLSFLHAEKCGSKSSCQALQKVKSVVKSRQEIYDDQNQKIKNLKEINAKYLLNLTGVNFYTAKELKLVYIWQQVDYQAVLTQGK